ncbi:unnamed protein product [Orchesella dallaii]|uniref:CHK kinase-like domain-containing protein n=1 Tax=Orchesella dallaii TaxID=48710 RepID=A0ABP1R2R4_9HEXA
MSSSSTQKLDAVQTQNEVTLKYKEIIKANGIHDEVSDPDVIVKDSGLQGAGMASQQLYVTVKFTDLNNNPLNLFVKAHTDNPHHSELIDEFKAFEKESIFFTEYIPTTEKFCKSKEQDGLLDFYPKCYYSDEIMMVFENLVLDKGYTLLKAEEKQDMEAVMWFAITNLAKDHAISYTFMKELGGPGSFFTQFKTLGLEAYTLPICRKAFESMIGDSIKLNIQILELTRHNSLGLDLGYYLFTSVKPNVRRNYLKDILETYLKTLQAIAEKLGHPIDLSYEELLLIVRKKIDLGFWSSMGFTNEAITTANKEINMNELGDLENFAIECNKWIQKWINENPQKVKETDEEIVKLMDEYNELSI